MSPTILEGLTVLELGSGSHAGALAGVLLADNGARAIKVEPPEGDRMRASDTTFVVLNRGKESVVADLRTEEGRTAARALADAADVIIESFTPGVAETFGIGYEDLRSTNPGLVYCSVSAFGPTGPNARIKGYEHVVQAKTGVSTMGEDAMFAHRPGPIFVNAPVASTGAGHLAAAGILGALIVRESTGSGQRVDATLLQGVTPGDYFGTMLWQLAHGTVTPPPVADDTGAGARATPAASRYSFMPCTKDGRWVFFTALLPHQMQAVARVLEIPQDPRFTNMPYFDSAEDAQAFEDAVWEAFRQRTFDEWDPMLRSDVNIAYELARTSEEGLDHPQVRSNGTVITIEDPERGPIEQVGPGATFSATPSRAVRPSPALGQHADLPPAVPARTSTGHGVEHPLSGVTIVEFGYFYASPFAVTMAASLGARVIKIEGLDGDPMRMSFGANDSGAAKTLEGKESLAVDLSTPEGKEIALAVIRKADMFVNGFRPGVAERNGLGYADLREVNPSLVYFHAGGYGVEGEFAPRPIFAQCASAVAGAVNRHSAVWAAPETNLEMGIPELQAVVLPRLRGFVDGDSNAALLNFSTLMLGLLHHQRTGEGQHIASDMLAGNLWAYMDDAVRYEGRPSLATSDPELYGTGALYRYYEAKEGWVFLAVTTDDEWRAFSAATGHPDLLHERFHAAPARADLDEELEEILESLFLTRIALDWEDLLVPLDVACVEVFEKTNSEFTNTDPFVREYGYAVEVDHPYYGTVVRHGLPIQFSETPGRIAPSCKVGEHNTEILRWLDYDEARISDLESAGIISSH